jgi:hypothetical protein
VCLIGLIIFVFFRIVYIVQWQEFYWKMKIYIE